MVKIISKNTKISHRGFTLIELLVVIGILAILATTAVLYLDPAQLLAESRDSQRLSDVDSVRNAINLYFSSAGIIVFPQSGNCADVASPQYWTSVAGAANTFLPGKAENASHSFSIDGSGYVPVDFNQITGGAPIYSLPQDPIADATYYYSFTCYASTKQFEIDANLESNRYTSGTENKEANDGGDNATIYENGTKLTL